MRPPKKMKLIEGQEGVEEEMGEEDMGEEEMGEGDMVEGDMGEEDMGEDVVESFEGKITHYRNNLLIYIR